MERLRKACPTCGPGIFMATHFNRVYWCAPASPDCWRRMRRVTTVGMPADRVCTYGSHAGKGLQAECSRLDANWETDQRCGFVHAAASAT